MPAPAHPTSRLSKAPAAPNPSPRYGPVRSLVRRAPLASFLILSCLLSWWPAGLLAAGVPVPPIAGFGPFLAAVIVLGVTQGRPGIGRLLKSMVQWRVPPRAYLLGIGLPLLVTGTAIGLTLALGAARPDSADLTLWMTLPIVVLLKLLIPGAGGAWEEPGFRGFALGRLEQRFGASAGPLVLGGFWVFWHLPLFVTGDILWTDVLEVVAASVVTAALFHSARDSVLIVMIFHATNNTIGGEFASQLFHNSDAITLGLLTAAGWWLVACGILIRARRCRGRDRCTSTAGEPA